jgi:hypothetical protein
MEGFRDIYWNGDIIVWRNLFKHYLLCLEKVCSLLLISGEKHTISIQDIPIFSNEDDYPTQNTKNYLLIYQHIFLKREPLKTNRSHIKTYNPER